MPTNNTNNVSPAPDMTIKPDLADHKGPWLIRHVPVMGAQKAWRCNEPPIIKGGFVHFINREDQMPYWLSGNIEISIDWKNTSRP